MIRLVRPIDEADRRGPRHGDGTSLLTLRASGAAMVRTRGVPRHAGFGAFGSVGWSARSTCKSPRHRPRSRRSALAVSGVNGRLQTPDTHPIQTQRTTDPPQADCKVTPRVTPAPRRARSGTRVRIGQARVGEPGPDVLRAELGLQRMERRGQFVSALVALIEARRTRAVVAPDYGGEDGPVVSHVTYRWSWPCDWPAMPARSTVSTVSSTQGLYDARRMKPINFFFRCKPRMADVRRPSVGGRQAA